MPIRLERTVTETPHSILSVFVCVCVIDLLTFHTDYRIGFEKHLSQKKGQMIVHHLSRCILEQRRFE